HHQIRCQMQAIGHPIKGDLKYGAKRPNADAGIDLCAQRIQFAHPVSNAPIDVAIEPEFSISF
nr:RNA pseudouridine synthase [Cryomorphaceae bacterium]